MTVLHTPAALHQSFPLLPRSFAFINFNDCQVSSRAPLQVLSRCEFLVADVFSNWTSCFLMSEKLNFSNFVRDRHLFNPSQDTAGTKFPHVCTGFAAIVSVTIQEPHLSQLVERSATANKRLAVWSLCLLKV